MSILENIKMNQAAVHLLEEWDPFHLGPDHYDTETADVVAALQGIDDPSTLAKLFKKHMSIRLSNGYHLKTVSPFLTN